MNIRDGYKQYGIDDYYSIHKNDYKNPHKKIIQSLLIYAKNNWDLGENILDLCCGSGEVSEIFLDRNIIGNDPYTYELYTKKINKPCYNKSFKDIVTNGLDKNYDTIICSFAMHLCEESMLPILLWRLSEKSTQLLILTPHKRPNCNNIFGWKLVKCKKEAKVTMNLYKQEC